jgi:hypothetical protein
MYRSKANGFFIMKFIMMLVYINRVNATRTGRWMIGCSTNNGQRMRKKRSMVLHPARNLLSNKGIKTSFTGLIRDWNRNVLIELEK